MRGRVGMPSREASAHRGRSRGAFPGRADCGCARVPAWFGARMSYSFRSYAVLPALILVAVLGAAGCGSIEGHTAGAVESAGAAGNHYASLDAALADAVTRLEGLAESPGTPESYLKTVADADASVASAAGALRGARASLLDHGREHVRLLNEESSKFADRELGRRFVVEAERLRRLYAAYESGTSQLDNSLELAHRYAEDVRRVVEANRTDAGVALVQPTLRKVVAELKVVQSRVPAARTALETLRKDLPQPPAKS